MEIKCLDKGFVRLVNLSHENPDQAIVQAARVSYGAGTKTKREDAGLIDYLMRHRHTSPFEMPHYQFHCKMPIFVARQYIRHRTANVNEISGRYSILQDEFYLPEVDRVCYQSDKNKQGSGGPMPQEYSENILLELEDDQRQAYEHYEQMLGAGMARELARMNLPLALYTEWYWQMDLHNLLHFLKLRLDSHAQYEIRVFAEAIAEIVKKTAPATWESFEEHILNGQTFSATEMKYLKHIYKVYVKSLGTEAMPFNAENLVFDQVTFLGKNPSKTIEFERKIK